MGSVFVFRHNNDQWKLTHTLRSSATTFNFRFGQTVDFSGNYLIGGLTSPDVTLFNIGINDCNADFIHDACEPDADADGVPDSCDNCMNHANTSQFDCDADGMGDVCQIALCPTDDAHCDDCNNNGFMDGCEPFVPPPSHIATLTATPAMPLANFGMQVAIDGTRILVGALNEDNGTNDDGAVYFFEYDGQDWHQSARFTPLPGFSQHRYGSYVDLKGNIAAVAARPFNFDRLSVVEVFEEISGRWVRATTLPLPIDLILGNEFYGNILDGLIAISDSFIVAGSPWDDEDGVNFGSLRVLQRVGNLWEPRAPLRVNEVDEGRGIKLGWSVAIAGNWMVSGAPGADVINSAGQERIDAGAAYIFRFNGVSWVQQAKLISGSPRTNGQFGISVDIDNETIIVGESGDHNAGVQGGAFVFRFNGQVWEQIGNFGELISDLSGRLVKIDNNTAIVGRFYILQFDGLGWELVDTIPQIASNNFGSSVGGDIDGPLAVIGANGNDLAETGGAVFVFNVDRSCERRNGVPSDCLVDSDGDFVDDQCDNCPLIANISQRDADGDGFGDACDVCPAISDFDQPDQDGDGVGDLCDNCVALANSDQADCDNDNIGDACVIEQCTGLSTCADCNANGVPDGCDLAHIPMTQQILASDGNAGDNFGSALAMDRNWAVVGARADDQRGPLAGSAYVLRFDSATEKWNQHAKLTALDAAPDDRFGTSVAMAGNTVVIGANFTDEGAPGAGAVYVFTRDLESDTWASQAKLTAPNASEGDQFGAAVAMSPGVIVVGAPRDDLNDAIDAGSAQVYTLDPVSNTWSHRATLSARDTKAVDFFGHSVATDGELIVVGAPNDDSQGTDAGAVYLFRIAPDHREAMLITKLSASDGQHGDAFGSSVAITGDTIVVGARLDDDLGLDSGSTYVFIGDGSRWIQQDKLLPADGLGQDEFGATVAIYGETIVVGASLHDVPGRLSAGSSYVFKFEVATNSWQQTADLRMERSFNFDFLGSSVAIGTQGILLGARGQSDSGSAAGAVTAFGFIRDCNNDDIPDACQIGDIDGNQAVDLNDVAQYASCLSAPCGPGGCATSLPYTPCCSILDADEDGDVDLKDFATHQQKFLR